MSVVANLSIQLCNVSINSSRWPELLKLKVGQFDEGLAHHGDEFSLYLPFLKYTHPKYGYLNLALWLLDNYSKPHLEPKEYIAYGFSKELRRGGSVIKLQYSVTDMVCLAPSSLV